MDIEEWRALGKGWLRQELETAWLRGYAAHYGQMVLLDERELAAADYAERVVGGSTKPERPEEKTERLLKDLEATGERLASIGGDPLPTPSKDENSRSGGWRRL